MVCTNCEVQNPPDARFCVNCGGRLSSRCLHCAAELPPAARFCPGCGHATKPDAAADREQTAATPAERKQVTALFADFAGFTAFVHKSDVEEVRDFISAVWGRFDGIIAAHGGITEKHIGDAVMAIFGGKQAREEDPVQAVRCALAMQASLAEHRPLQGPRAQMRIGVHTGLVIVGPLGASGEFTATGDAVNLCNRLQENAPPGGVLVSHDTYRLVYGYFDVVRLPAIELKGRGEPVEVYQVLGAKPRSVANQLRGIEGVQTEMIGREPELKRLQSALEEVMQERQSQVITVVGEAGIGKSCLLHQFQSWVDLLPQSVRLFGGRAMPEMAGLPFGLMRDLFCSRFEIQESDPPELAREKLEKGLMGLGIAGLQEGSAADEDMLVQSHLIGQLLGFDFSQSPHLRDLGHDPNQVRERAFHDLSRFFSRMGDGAPVTDDPTSARAVLLVAEDIHWADDGSLDLLDYLARNCAAAPLLIVCLARPDLFERRPAWGEGVRSHVRMDLGPLSRRESKAMVNSILSRTKEVPQALRELIIGGAEGNPFFIEEIVKMLIDQQVILRGVEQWAIQPQELVAVRVPPTLTGVLQARLDSLGAVERIVLQRASVIGRVFWDRGIECMRASSEGKLSREELLGALASLRQKELIFRRESSAFAGAAEYTFKHELFRNVALESLLKKSRRQHHGQVARWLMDQSGQRVSEFSALIALHLEQAGQLAEAADWYGLAGQQAQRGYVPATAMDHFRKAAALMPADGEPDPEHQLKRLAWHEGLGEALGAQALFTEAAQSFDKMRLLAEALRDIRGEARAWNGLAFLHERQGRNRSSIDCAQKAEQLAREAGETGRKELIRALHLQGWAFYRLGDAAAVLRFAEQTSELCGVFQDKQGSATSFKLLGVAHLQQGHYRQAEEFFEKGLACFRELGDRRNTAAMYSNLGESARFRGDYPASVELYEKALQIAGQIGHRESELIYRTNLGAAHLGLNAFQQAETDLRQAIALTTGPNFCVLAEAYTLLAESCFSQEKGAEALEFARRGLALAKESENDLYLASAWRTLGQVIAAGKNSASMVDGLPPAEDCFAESLNVFEKMNAQGEQGRTLRAWGQFDVHRGRCAEGEKKLRRAKDIFEGLGASAEAARTETLLQDASSRAYSG